MFCFGGGSGEKREGVSHIKGKKSVIHLLHESDQFWDALGDGSMRCPFVGQPIP